MNKKIFCKIIDGTFKNRVAYLIRDIDDDKIEIRVYVGCSDVSEIDNSSHTILLEIDKKYVSYLSKV